MNVLAARQNPQAVLSFNFANGLVDNVYEQTVTPLTAGQVSVGTINILEQAFAQNIPLLYLNSSNAGSLDALDISADAKARIVTAIQQGDVVVTPAQMVMVGDISTISWLEINPTTGEVSGVLPDGTRSNNDEGGVVPGSRTKSPSSRKWQAGFKKRPRPPKVSSSGSRTSPQTSLTKSRSSDC